MLNRVLRATPTLQRRRVPLKPSAIRPGFRILAQLSALEVASSHFGSAIERSIQRFGNSLLKDSRQRYLLTVCDAMTESWQIWHVSCGCRERLIINNQLRDRQRFIRGRAKDSTLSVCLRRYPNRRPLKGPLRPPSSLSPTSTSTSSPASRITLTYGQLKRLMAGIPLKDKTAARA